GNTSSTSVGPINIDETAPALHLPSNIVAEATGPNGAAVSFPAVTATDNLDPAPVVSCDHASGATYPLDVTTTVHCCATAPAGTAANGAFTTRVQDTTPPTLTLPSDILATATSNLGAVVGFSVSATDLVDGPITPIAFPASGSVFPPGQTVVNVSA